MCESDEQYVPLNDGFNWKGDPNATLSGQPVPQPPPSAPVGSERQPPAPEPPPAVAEYDPAAGAYLRPDGRRYSRTEPAGRANANRSWKDLILPP